MLIKFILTTHLLNASSFRSSGIQATHLLSQRCARTVTSCVLLNTTGIHPMKEWHLSLRPSRQSLVDR